MMPRSFNQDPVENFFSSIRSHGVRNNNPTCSSFESSTKSLIINNLVSAHSVGANCESDESVGMLSNLKSFLDLKKPTTPPVQEELSIINERPSLTYSQDKYDFAGQEIVQNYKV